MHGVFIRPASELQDMVDTLRALLIRRGVHLESWLLERIKEETCSLPSNTSSKASARSFKAKRRTAPSPTQETPEQAFKRPTDASTTVDELFPETAPGCFVDLLNLRRSVKNETGPYFLEHAAYLNREALSEAWAAYLPEGFLLRTEPLESLVPDAPQRLAEWREAQSKIPESQSPLVYWNYLSKSGPVYLDDDFYTSLFSPAETVDELATRKEALLNLPSDYLHRVRPISSRTGGRPKKLPSLPECHLQLKSSLEPAGDYNPLTDNPRIYTDEVSAIDAGFLNKLIRGEVTLDVESYDFEDFDI